jgi:hypothetical protein
MPAADLIDGQESLSFQAWRWITEVYMESGTG